MFISICLYAILAQSADKLTHSDDHFVCICRCCYLGECEPVLTFSVENQADCEKRDCMERLHPQIEAARGDAVRVLGAGLNSTSYQRCPVDTHARAGSLTSTEICIVINLLERETCIGHDRCKSTTTIEAFCVNNHWIFGKMSVFMLMFCLSALLCFQGLQLVLPMARQVLRWLRTFER
ncbi:phage recombination protein Bet [Perkinsela sp. CCAP 1560/4]|nr:phage recombination protein Bet [Perkinsela sp. CCAP 1560/4]|eukprot:KNH07273.1 phage recombination protein Bet [Perkinsela sp. CCAP 1560/4]